MVLGAYYNDVPRFFRAESMSRKGASIKLAYPYMFFMTQQMLWKRYGRLPTEDEIDRLAEQLAPRWQERLNTPVADLVSNLRDVSNIRELPSQIEDHASTMAVTLALLLDSPEHELADFRPVIAEIFASQPRLQAVTPDKRI
jgi:hypothetical protein